MPLIHLQTRQFRQLQISHSVALLLLSRLTYRHTLCSFEANRQALRCALILSAAQDSKFTLLEVMQNYPISEVEVEGKRLAQVSLQLSTFRGRIQDLLGSYRLF